MVICPDCGKEVPKSKFCKNCGAYIENVEEPVQIESETSIPVIGEAEEPVEIESEAPVEEASQTEDVVVQNHPEVTKSVKYCFNCGYELGGDFHFCPNCGCDLKPKDMSNKKSLSVNEEKNILLAIILSVFLPGLGQIYLGLDRKGAIFLIAYVVSAILIILLIGFSLVIVIWIWALVDTIQSTNALNRGDVVEDKLF